MLCVPSIPKVGFTQPTSQVTLLDMLKTGNEVEVVITEELGRRVIILAPGFRHNLFTRSFLGDNADRNLKAQFEDQLKARRA